MIKRIASRPSRSAEPTAETTVTVHVHSLAQLLNSLDPSPFWDRDLDHEAAEFIEGEFADRPAERSWILHVTTNDAMGFTRNDVQRAVHEYYRRLEASCRREQREAARLGRISISIGVAVFAACMVGRELLRTWAGAPLPEALAEGTVVLGWIAVWIPVEQLIHSVLALVRRRRSYERLAAVRVHLTVRHAGSNVPIAPADEHPAAANEGQSA